MIVRSVALAAGILAFGAFNHLNAQQTAAADKTAKTECAMMQAGGDMKDCPMMKGDAKAGMAGMHHDGTAGMNHDGMAGMNHDGMAGMHHDGSPAMHHEGMAGMDHQAMMHKAGGDMKDMKDCPMMKGDAKADGKPMDCAMMAKGQKDGAATDCPMMKAAPKKEGQ